MVKKQNEITKKNNDGKIIESIHTKKYKLEPPPEGFRSRKFWAYSDSKTTTSPVKIYQKINIKKKIRKEQKLKDIARNVDVSVEELRALEKQPSRILTRAQKKAQAKKLEKKKSTPKINEKKTQEFLLQISKRKRLKNQK